MHRLPCLGFSPPPCRSRWKARLSLCGHGDSSWSAAPLFTQAVFEQGNPPALRANVHVSGRAMDGRPGGPSLRFSVDVSKEAYATVLVETSPQSVTRPHVPSHLHTPQDWHTVCFAKVELGVREKKKKSPSLRNLIPKCVEAALRHFSLVSIAFNYMFSQSYIELSSPAVVRQANGRICLCSGTVGAVAARTQPARVDHTAAKPVGITCMCVWIYCHPVQHKLCLAVSFLQRRSVNRARSPAASSVCSSPALPIRPVRPPRCPRPPSPSMSSSKAPVMTRWTLLFLRLTLQPVSKQCVYNLFQYLKVAD